MPWWRRLGGLKMAGMVSSEPSAYKSNGSRPLAEPTFHSSLHNCRQRFPMNATEILVNEHRVITQMLNCLEKIIEQATAAERLEEEPAREAIDFFRTFAEHCHQRKEENYLFPLIQARGFSGNCGPLSVMQCEHELGRLHLDGMDGAIELASKGDINALHRFVQHGRSYIRLEREHMR